MASRVPIDQTLLADLVERRLEAPDVEYKNWMPLVEPVERANIARHICALANAGGGWLVFGFDDDGAPSDPRPESLAAYNQDAINGIAARYLEPAPHCEVHEVTAASGQVYPVIRVPAHGIVPICAKSDGPQEKNKPQGISKGVHYIRIAGPQSVPMNTPELWRDVIRRCVLAERAGLLSSIGQLFDGPQITSDDTEQLGGIVDQVLTEWETVQSEGWPVSLAENRVAFAFRFIDASGQPVGALDLQALNHAIRNSSFASSDTVRNGGASFEMTWDEGTRPRVTIIGDREAYRSLRSDGVYTLPALWIVRDDGVGVEVEGIAEDSNWTRQAVEGRGRTRPWPHGERLAPTFQVDSIAQHVAFARKLAESYPDAATCELLVDYRGLADRQLDEPAPGAYFSLSRSTAVDSRRIVISIGIATLTAELPETTAALIGPIFRLFDGWNVGADYVRAHLERR